MLVTLTVVAAIAGAPAVGAVGVVGAQTVGDPTGHWTFSYELPAPARGRGAGRAGAAGRGGAPAKRTIDLHLTLGPGESVTGTLGWDVGRSSGAPGTNPLRPVEISDGRLDGHHLTFSAWQFDRNTNRVRYDGVLDGDTLDLTMRRDTGDGIETIEVQATRVEE